MDQKIIDEISMLRLDLSKKENEIFELKNNIEKLKKSYKDKLSSAFLMQQAMFSPVEIIEDSISDYFILFQPQDLISGDFYWFRKIEGGEKIIIVVADAMGHGIPGAFISILAISALNNIVMKRNICQPDIILSELREYIIWEFQQKIRGKDSVSIDMAVILYDVMNKRISFSGAKRPLYLLNDTGLNIYDGDKVAVGFHSIMDEFSQTIFRYSPEEFKDSFVGKAEQFSYKLHEIDLKKGDQIYLFSDGYVSQFGGNEKSMVFGTRVFKNIIASLNSKTMIDQKDILENTLQEWQGKNEQTDDILILGLKV